jgi:hypothetical protein
MNWTEKADELKAKHGDALAAHASEALAFIQKKYGVQGTLSIENDAVSRAGMSEGELIDTCIRCGFDSTDFAGLIDKMTADYYAKLESLAG